MIKLTHYDEPERHDPAHSPATVLISENCWVSAIILQLVKQQHSTKHMYLKP